LNLIRMKAMPKERLFIALWPAIAAFTIVTVVVAKLHLPVQGIIVVLLLGALVTEALASRREPSGHRWFFATLGCIAVAGTFSALDASRKWCDPSSHWLQGHAIWHMLAAVSLVLSLMHYRQFRGHYV
jgi:hypothetical protein